MQVVVHTPAATSHMQPDCAAQSDEVTVTAQELVQLEEAEFHMHWVSTLQAVELACCWQPAPQVCDALFHLQFESAEQRACVV